MTSWTCLKVPVRTAYQFVHSTYVSICNNNVSYGSSYSTIIPGVPSPALPRIPHIPFRAPKFQFLLPVKVTSVVST